MASNFTMLVLLALVLLGEDVVQSLRQSLSPSSSSSSSFVCFRGVGTVRSPGGGGGSTGRCLDRGARRIFHGHRGVACPSTALCSSVEHTFDLVSILADDPLVTLGFAVTWAQLIYGIISLRKGTKELLAGTKGLGKALEDSRREAREDAKAIMRMARDDAMATRREARENLILLLLIAILVEWSCLLPVPP